MIKKRKIEKSLITPHVIYESDPEKELEEIVKRDKRNTVSKLRKLYKKEK